MKTNFIKVIKKKRKQRLFINGQKRLHQDTAQKLKVYKNRYTEKKNYLPDISFNFLTLISYSLHFEIYCIATDGKEKLYAVVLEKHLEILIFKLLIF